LKITDHRVREFKLSFFEYEMNLIGVDMLNNDHLDQWDRENFFHPSTHLAEFTRG